MRHRRKGRMLGRSPSHQRALLRNLACSLVSDRARRRGRRQQAQGQGPDRHHLAKGQGSPPGGRKGDHARLPQPSRPDARPTSSPRLPNAIARPGASGARATGGSKWSQAIAPVGHGPPRGSADAGRQAGRAACCSLKSLPASLAATAATPACCGWPSPAWAMPAPGPSWSSSACAIG